MTRFNPYTVECLDVERDGMSCPRVFPRIGYAPARMRGGQDLGWVQAVVQGVMAAKSAIKANPKAAEIKRKLDKLSVGKHLTRAVKRLISGPGVSKAEKTWDAWRKEAMGQVPGSALDNASFEEAFKGMWDTNNRDFPGFAKYRNDRETFKADLVSEILKAITAGAVTDGDTAESIYAKVVAPWLNTVKPGGIPSNREDLRQMVIALVDRYIYDLAIARGDMPEYGGAEGSAIPKLSVALEQIFPPASQAPAIAVPAAAVPSTIAPPAIAAPAPLPPGATAADVASAVKQIADALLATQQGASLSTPDQANAVNAAALEWLKTQGLSPSSPAVQETVAQASTASVARAGTEFFIPALAVGAVIAIASTTRKERRAQPRRRRSRRP